MSQVWSEYWQIAGITLDLIISVRMQREWKGLEKLEKLKECQRQGACDRNGGLAWETEKERVCQRQTDGQALTRFGQNEVKGRERASRSLFYPYTITNNIAKLSGIFNFQTVSLQRHLGKSVIRKRCKNEHKIRFKSIFCRDYIYLLWNHHYYEHTLPNCLVY